MIKTKFKPNNLILFIVLLLSIFPTINIGSFGMPVLYLLLPMGGLLFLLIIFGWIKIPRILKHITFITILIIIEIFISAMIGTITKFNKFIFPTDVIQYIARLLFLISFTVIFYKGNIKADVFIKFFLIFLNIGMLIGILQWIPWPGREFFIKLYPFRDGTEQLSQLNRSLYILRLHGVAQFATANGGLASFFFIFGYSVFKYYKEHRFLSILLMILSIVNIFASQARAGILALVFSFFLFYIVGIYINKKSFKSTMNMFIAMLLIILIVRTLFNRGNPFINQMIYRWKVLFDTRGGGRVDQIRYFLSLFRNSYDYIFGLSKATVNQSALSYGVEIEPINIFITYGALGFILQYFLVLMLLVYFLKNIQNAIDDKTSLTLLVSSFVGLFSYQIFSVGYYFFREIRVGLFPWILMGVAIGVYERHKLNNIIVKSNQ
ncbi:MAG: hypothetical protein KZY61_03560 [Clostridiaceae bacterium]|nr:hypothetical protein [Clostridiaceae bacterium]MBW4860681.1 hypothetical protein [Clostridiaceae bacterium]MBW4867737.1 hypothetical protein [Clostridiaceae bacterium]